MITVIKLNEDKYMAYIKGAAEIILSQCTKYQSNNSV